MQINGAPIIAHFSNAFFVKSETFIYHYLSHMRSFKPICLGWRIENLGEGGFFFPVQDIYSLQLGRCSLKWFYYGILKRIFRHDFYFENILKKRGARLLHAHFGHNGVQVLKVKKNVKIPLVTTFYGADLSKRDMVEPLMKRYKKLFARGEMFLVEGEHMKLMLRDLGCPPEKIHIQRIAIPVDTIQYKERKPKGRNITRLFFCGRFTEKKGLVYALEAVKKVYEEHRCRNIRFCIIGDGELKAEIEAFITRNRMTEYVELPGFLSYRDYLKKVEEADIFLHPSVTASDGDSEGGAPTTILEAQAMGLPIVSTEHADIPNVVVPNRSALLSAERNVEALTRNILFLLENQQLWSVMGKVGREFVEEYHNIKKEVPNLEEKYRTLIER
jgi:colanic acid/amylovoran biosynthesis glycosyltransferase